MEYLVFWKNKKIVKTSFNLNIFDNEFDKIDYDHVGNEFDIHKYTINDCLLDGTEFQKRVWLAIASIPKGSTRTYGELVRLVGGSPQAVGTACGKNKIPVVIPCHRVVGIKNKLAFSSGPEIKRSLLAEEGVFL